MRLERRGFLTLLGAGTLGAALPPVFAADEQERPPVRRLRLATFAVAGVQHHDADRPDVAARLVAGLGLDLRREPGNPYDACAIALHLPVPTRPNGLPEPGPHLGYVPRRLNAILATLLDDGARIEATLDAVRRDAVVWERLTVSLWVRAEADVARAPDRYAPTAADLLVPIATPPTAPTVTGGHLRVAADGVLSWHTASPNAALPPSALELRDVRQRLHETWVETRTLDDALDAALHDTDAEAIAGLPVRAARETGRAVNHTVADALDDLRSALVGAETER